MAATKKAAAAAAALVFLVFAAVAGTRATAFKSIHCIMKDHLMEHCREYLQHSVPIPEKSSECCKKARVVPVWDKLIKCLTKAQQENTIFTGRMRNLAFICRLPAAVPPPAV